MRSLQVGAALAAYGAALVACSSEPAQPDSNVCLYEEGTCHGAYSEVVGDSILYIDGTCPPGDGDYQAKCDDIGERADCSSQQQTTYDSFEGTNYTNVRRNVRLVLGADCDTWREDPAAIEAKAKASSAGDPEPAADAEPAATVSSAPSSDPEPPAADSQDEDACPFRCAASSDFEASCWGQEVACESITQCGDDVAACPNADQNYDCAVNKCVECPIEPEGDSCMACVKTHCCATLALCLTNETCAACDAASCPLGEQPELDALTFCIADYCGEHCASAAQPSAQETP